MREWSPSIVSHLMPLTVVDNRVFLLGLDHLYREAMKGFETRALLPDSRAVARVLQVSPANVPVEGYYVETPELKEYFLLMRALQAEKEEREAQVGQMPEFRRLWNVTSSALYGRPQRQGKLFAVGRDPLSQALNDSIPDWVVETLVRAAYQAALRYDDISLVGLAARAQDPIALTALRETTVLYEEIMSFGLAEEPEVTWQVDSSLVEAANRFIETFNQFVPGGLPKAEAANAGDFAEAYQDNDFIGRCVRIGKSADEKQHYHWAVATRRVDAQQLELVVDAFWDSSLWTTERYRSTRKVWDMPSFPEASGPEDDESQWG